MTKAIAVLALGAALVAPTLASAEDETGRIGNLNSWSITLQNGKFFTVSNGKMLENLKPGDEVKVTYVETPDEDKAVKVEPKSTK